MTSRLATCACRQLKLTCQGEPVRISVCHCYECQKRTGSVFGTQARFKEEDVRVEGKSKTFTRQGDSGASCTFHFCPNCGSTVYWQPDAFKGFCSVAIGAFADVTFPAPTVSVYHEDRHHSWVKIPHLDIN